MASMGPKHVVVHLAIKYTYVTQLCLTIYNFQVFLWDLELPEDKNLTTYN